MRGIVGVTRLKSIRNDAAYARTSMVRKMSARADSRVLSWFGHRKSMDDRRFVKRGVKSEVSDHRPSAS